MKKKWFLLGLVCLSLASCSKSFDNIITDVRAKSYRLQIESERQFVSYSILKGQQYCDKNIYQAIEYDQLSFIVKFDSSAIYKTSDPANQNDINKLFGFSDNNKTHHEFSARFGWRWSNNALRLFAYIYNNSVMSNKEIGVVTIGKENKCTISVTDSTYIFKLNDGSLVMPRASKTAKAEGYRLYPYFGGDELAPHTISILMKEL